MFTCGRNTVAVTEGTDVDSTTTSCGALLITPKNAFSNYSLTSVLLQMLEAHGHIVAWYALQLPNVLLSLCRLDDENQSATGAALSFVL